MTDSLNNSIKLIERATDNGLELINKVDSFYNSAWDKLILVGSVAFGVIGILVPFVIQWYQKKTLQISEELMKKEMEGLTMRLKSELLDYLDKNIEKRIKLFEEKIEKLYASMNAKTFHLQGNESLKNGYIQSALSDYIISAVQYLFCEDYMNLDTVLKLILDQCIPKLSLEEIDLLKISHDCNLEYLLENLTKQDEKGRFIKIIREIRIKLSKLPRTINDKTQS